ncbi:MAG: barstar family protein [Geodermatophilaceae bacterium]|jgi:hypothetical protein|nr:barstar family protein [Geodermatophilaceae bacterium]
MSAWLGRPGLFHVGAAASVRALALESETSGSAVYLVSSVGSKQELLDTLAEQLHFPLWAARNWDAAADLLADLSWLPPGPVTLLWAEPEVLADADAAAHRMAVEVLTYAARVIRSRVLTVLLVHRGPH